MTDIAILPLANVLHLMFAYNIRVYSGSLIAPAEVAE